MRYIIYGAGAVGGVIGARLHQAGKDVILIARGEHLRVIQDDGLTLEAPGERATLRIPAAASPAEIDFEPDDAVVLAMKTQDTQAALNELAAAAPGSIAVLCAQNGVENERLALRKFENVYGVMLNLPAKHLTPGVVGASSGPVTGILECGRYPSGVDATIEAIVSDFAASTFEARALPDVMRWKYGKLLSNVGNAIEALCRGDTARLRRMAADETIACYKAAGIEWASETELGARRAQFLRLAEDGSTRREGGSSWQSLARATGSIESDYLNGEIVLLGRLHGVPTPVNHTLQVLANDASHRGFKPGAYEVEDVIARAEALVSR